MKTARNTRENSEKLQAKLAFPSKLPTMYLEITNKLTLINNCEFHFDNILIVHLQWQKG